MLRRGFITLGLCLGLLGCNQILGIHEPILDDTVMGDGGSGSGPGDVASEVSAGFFYTCAQLEDRSVKCWGHNENGKLGLEDTFDRGDMPGEMGDKLPTVNLGFAAATIRTGYHHTCARLLNDTLKCWGQNDIGQLGQGDKKDRGGAPGEMSALQTVSLGNGAAVKGVAVGAYHTCVVLSDSHVKCWGENAEGTLGLGHTDSLGWDPAQMGDNLPEVNLGASVKVEAVVAGNGFTCALMTIGQTVGQVKCWGKNADGELGQDDVTPRGAYPEEISDNLPSINLGMNKTVKQITAGDSHACAILNDDTVKCWGKNWDGQLGLGDTASRGAASGDMGSLLAVNLGPGEKVKAIAAGGNHTCAVLADGRVKCWGDNQFGQLGLGDSDSRGGKSSQMGEKLPAVNLGAGKTAKAIAAGGDHTCAHLEDGSVKCWGMNVNGQLGLPGGGELGADPAEMGDALPTVKLYSPE